MSKKRQSNVPVFLIYAGIIHAVGLALLLPMLITLPRPGSEIAPEAAAIDVEIVPAAPLAGTIAPNGEQTSALPVALPAEKAEAAAPAGPESGPEEEQEEAFPREEPEKADTAAPDKGKPEAAKSTNASAAKPAKKAVAARRTGKPASRRPAKTQTKIAPFNGALTGLFSPGAPAKRR